MKQVILNSMKGILFTLIWTFSLNVYAQNVAVRGTVTDTGGEPLVGVTVRVQGATSGTITDIEGNFNLSNVPPNATLEVSYVGMRMQTVGLKGRSFIAIVLEEDAELLDEVVVVGYGAQKKVTVTGAISTVGTETLLRSPNASVANALAGQVPGLSSVQQSGQPGLEDPSLYVRGTGSLTVAASNPLILVDGVERSFNQLDPNEIESISVLKDASATAVFGVRGANGVIIVTTKRGTKGKPKIKLSSSVGLQSPVKQLQLANSYTYALALNEQYKNDNNPNLIFDDFTLERFRLNDDPIMYPSIDWRDYLTNKYAMQTQHNLTVSGGSDQVKYFISAGYLHQDGFFKTFGAEYGGNYKYDRYNYRANLDIDLTKSTKINFGIGGIVGNTTEPYDISTNGIWYVINETTPFTSAGVVDGKLIVHSSNTYYFNGVLQSNVLSQYYNQGWTTTTRNTGNFDMKIQQDLDLITKGLSFETKAAINTSIATGRGRRHSIETLDPYYLSSLEDATLPITDPTFDRTIVYKTVGTEGVLSYVTPSTSKARDWYIEGSLRYDRRVGNHNVGAMVLYNQKKTYWPSQYRELPTAYVGLVGRLTYDYKYKYLAEFNMGYNGSENFAPDKRFGFFPAGSLGYVVTEEDFMKNQKFVDFLKLRISAGLVGNDNMSNNRYLYLPSTYKVDQIGYNAGQAGQTAGYYFGVENPNAVPGAIEQRIGNPNVTWEKSFKQNYGIDLHVLDSRLKITADVFKERRWDILITRSTIPVYTAFTSALLPVTNLGKVDNQGYEIEATWNQAFKNISYWISGNISYAKNKIVFQDEVEPNEPYMWRTGQSVGSRFGYVAEGFYNESDFDENGNLLSTLPQPSPSQPLYPGDVKYKDLNGDGLISSDDQTTIGYPNRPQYTFGLNYGFRWKNFSMTMSWLGAAQRDLLLGTNFYEPFRGENRSLLQFQYDERWTPETAETAVMPRLSKTSRTYNYRTSSLLVRDGSYIRLRNMTLGYDLSYLSVLNKLGISGLSVELTGFNLLTFSPFKIMDPESQPDNSDTYPVMKLYNLGLKVTF